MIQIPYPNTKAGLKAFKDNYTAAVKSVLDARPKLNNTLAKITLANGDPLTWEYLLTAPFQELPSLHAEIEKQSLISKQRKNNLAPLSQYTKMQTQIAAFFMAQQDIELISCYYCNIDSIFSFSQLGDFKGGLDFINRASLANLQLFPGIKLARAQKIYKLRKIKSFTAISESQMPISVQKDLLAFDESGTHNHFTLDHFYLKKTFPYLSLCLFNFVPSCYACNSKFKGEGKLYDTDATYSSPSSPHYSFHKDVTFKLWYHQKNKSIKKQDDYAIELDFSNNQASHEAFISQLKIRGRYAFHKKEALRLIKLSVDYPDTRIKEMADAIGMSFAEVKKQVFGRELFESEFDHHPLVKYKRDIARNIKIIP
ncbi:hypothetical protein [Mucilaginibacter flavus]|uniref:hypothetical protein n=1 Tax=Mucilaginibacter flavus TaxID=931504 RepID=UPI0025B2F77D|nr:hypothetical protein [Mucilaginibacter flavus]MDN3582112.1 hypothetical protein [Mucilaginibacter flavus]